MPRTVSSCHSNLLVFSFLLLAAICVAAGVGCEQPSQNATTVSNTAIQGYEQKHHSPASQPAETLKDQPPSGRPIAFVNDVPIDRAALIQLLLEGRGLNLLQQMMLREAARQEAKRQGLTATPEDVDHEYDLTLQAARYDGKDVQQLTPARREQLIEEWTRSRGVPRQELAVAMERQTYLRKIAQGRVKISGEMLQQEYKRAHGEKVEVRHIQLAASRAWEQVKQRLDGGDDFAVLVRDYSQNALSREKNGLLPAFSADDSTVPAAFAKAAFALEVGQVSNPIEVEGSFHVLKLERRIPPDSITFEQAREELQENLVARLVAEEMDRLAGELFMRAKLRIEDPALREQYKKRQKAGEIAGPALSGQ